jgi:hypothetical protein
MTFTAILPDFGFSIGRDVSLFSVREAGVRETSSICAMCFREVGTTDALLIDGLIGRGERAPPGIGIRFGVAAHKTLAQHLRASAVVDG